MQLVRLGVVHVIKPVCSLMIKRMHDSIKIKVTVCRLSECM